MAVGDMGTKKCAQMIINGEERIGTGEEFPALNPATGKVIGTARDAIMSEIAEVCQVAREAQRYWACDHTPLQTKENVFLRFFQKLDDDDIRYQIAYDMCKEAGKTIEECDWDVQEVIDTYRHYMGEVSRIHGRQDWCQLKNKIRYTLRLPYGVVAACIPFNFPGGVWGWKSAAALAAGNSIVVKDAEQTPCTAPVMTKLFLESLREEIGDGKHFRRTRGILNVIHGRGDVGEKTGVNLVAHGDYDLMVFTGGVETGRKICEVTGRRLKPCHPELGGHARVVLLSDYIRERSLEKAVGEVIRGHMGTNAQRCVSARAGLVEGKNFDDVVRCHVEMAKSWKIGDPLDPDTKFGPLIEEAAVQRCERVVDELAKQGFYPIMGGYRLSPDTVTQAREGGFNFDAADFRRNGKLSRGFYFVPTLYTDLPMNARPVQEEIFGPIFFYNRLPDAAPEDLPDFERFLLDEHLEIRDPEARKKMARYLLAIHLVNQSEYGLSNSVLTTDLTESWLASYLIYSGLTYIGRGPTGAEVPGEFGGVRNSGWGRDGEGVEDYTWVKTVYVDSHPSVRMAQAGSLEKLKANLKRLKDK